jgi:hypothetical protein
MSTAHTKRTTLRDHVPGCNLSGNEPGASCDGDSGPQGAHNDPKPGNHPELGPVLAPGVGPAVVAAAEELSRTAPASAAPPAARSRRRRPSAAPPA